MIYTAPKSDRSTESMYVPHMSDVWYLDILVRHYVQENIIIDVIYLVLVHQTESNVAIKTAVIQVVIVKLLHGCHWLLQTNNLPHLWQ